MLIRTLFRNRQCADRYDTMKGLSGEWHSITYIIMEYREMLARQPINLFSICSMTTDMIYANSLSPLMLAPVENNKHGKGDGGCMATVY